MSNLLWPAFDVNRPANDGRAVPSVCDEVVDLKTLSTRLVAR